MTDAEIERWLDRHRARDPGLYLAEWEARIDPTGPCDPNVPERLWPKEKRFGLSYWHWIGKNRHRVHVVAPTREGAVLLASAKEQELNAQHATLGRKR